MPGAVLVGLTAAGLVLLVQSPSTGGVVALVGAVLLALESLSRSAWRPNTDSPYPMDINPARDDPRGGRED